ncbi:hypothetical protein KIL84_006544 [Mauremys mutica]|uniref:Uncharacterized protein n=1 Tax=Mauremys mutica TaxID=74926 RepID=A0A9D4AW53_9SAUR|nr:hypothetical protein KIL84_006544 [Mauremys mutica]
MLSAPPAPPTPAATAAAAPSPFALWIHFSFDPVSGAIWCLRARKEDYAAAGRREGNWRKETRPPPLAKPRWGLGAAGRVQAWAPLATCEKAKIISWPVLCISAAQRATQALPGQL